MTLRATLQRWIFNALYGPGARLYDAFTDWLFLGEWVRWQATALPELPASGWILELGCGTGQLARLGITPGRHWIGLDRSLAMLRAADSRRARVQPCFVLGEAERLPFAAASFDAVVATFPAPFIVVADTAREVRRVLRPAGVVVIVITAELVGRDSHRRWRRRLLAAFYGHTARDCTPAIRWPGFLGTEKWRPTPFGRARIIILLPEERP